jgi:hypothetical protein
MLSRVAAVCLIALAGCGKETNPAPPPAPKSNASAPDAQSAPAEEARVAAALQVLTQAVRRYGVEQRRAPTSLDELVSNGYLDGIPQPPAGKKFAINKNLQVYVTSP